MAKKLYSMLGKACEVALEVVLTIVLTPILPALLSVAWAVFLRNSTQFANAIRDYPLQIAVAGVVSFALGLYLGFTIRLVKGYVDSALARTRNKSRQTEAIRQVARQLPYDSKVFLAELAEVDHMDVLRDRAQLQHIEAIYPEIIAVSEIAYGVLRVTLTDAGRVFVEQASDILGEARPDIFGMWWEA